MTDNGLGTELVADDELRLVHGGRSFWGTVKAAAKWAKDHVVIGLRYIGIKGRF
jgi:hypothetical protein